MDIHLLILNNTLMGTCSRIFQVKNNDTIFILERGMKIGFMNTCKKLLISGSKNVHWKVRIATRIVSSDEGEYVKCQEKKIKMLRGNVSLIEDDVNRYSKVINLMLVVKSKVNF